MYSDEDLDAAVAAGVLGAAEVGGFRRFMAERRLAPPSEHESFKLLSGFNDIFIAIALTITVFALDRLIGGYSSAAIAVAAWGLAEYFTRRRRAPLTSILLLLIFTACVFQLVFKLAGGNIEQQGTHFSIFDLPGVLTAAIAAALVTAAATYAHWRRFQVPITVAVAVLVALVLAGALLLLVVEPLRTQVPLLVLVGGLVAFATAMVWDMRDPSRRGRASDVAFWLHLLAAPLIIHPLFNLLGLIGGTVYTGALIGGLAIYLVLGLVSLVIDRRALLVSALVYVIYAMTGLMSMIAADGYNLAVAALLIGSGLLLLSAKWEAARRLVVGLLPDAIRARVPAVRTGTAALATAP